MNCSKSREGEKIERKKVGKEQNVKGNLLPGSLSCACPIPQN